jgi:5'-3' exonuclease
VTAGGLLLLDTPSLYFRAFYGVPESVTAPDGTPVNAVRGTIDFLARLVRDRRPARVVATMDEDWRPAWRVAAVPSYKAHRVGVGGGDQAPDALNVQVPILTAVLAAVGIAEVGVPGYEADDVIGSCAAQTDAAVDVVTGDRDLLQLVRDDQPVRVLYTGRGVARAEVADEGWVQAKYGVPARHYADFALLRGDPSDGLPGVAGIGEKTAAALVSRFGAVEAIVAAAGGGADDGFPPGARRKVLAAADYLEAAAPVVRVATDLGLPAVDDRLPAAPRDPQALVELSERWGLDSPLSRLLGAMRSVTAA